MSEEAGRRSPAGPGKGAVVEVRLLPWAWDGVGAGAQLPALRSPALSPDSRAAEVISLSTCLPASLSPALSMHGVLSPQSRCPLPWRCSRLGGTLGSPHPREGLKKALTILCPPACLPSKLGISFLAQNTHRLPMFHTHGRLASSGGQHLRPKPGVCGRQYPVGASPSPQTGDGACSAFQEPQGGQRRDGGMHTPSPEGAPPLRVPGCAGRAHSPGR